jgi:hypothetical protein
VAAFFPPFCGNAPNLGLLPLHKHKKFTMEFVAQTKREDIMDDIMIWL